MPAYDRSLEGHKVVHAGAGFQISGEEMTKGVIRLQWEKEYPVPS